MTNMLKPIYETDGDFYYEESEGYSTFEITPQSGCIERGLFFPESKIRYIHLSRHENLEDILSTTEHEDIHAAIALIKDWEIEENKEKDCMLIDDRREHRIIKIMLQPEWYGLI